jgi:hypothetical protein
MFLLIYEWFVPSTEASNFELGLLNFFFAAREVLLLGPFYSLITKFKIGRHSRMDEFQIRHTIGKIIAFKDINMSGITFKSIVCLMVKYYSKTLKMRGLSGFAFLSSHTF